MAGHKKVGGGVSKAYREQRWKRCRFFIRQSGTLDGARRLAKQQHFSADTSVWLTAMSQILGGRTD